MLFALPLTRDRTSRQKTSKEIKGLNNTTGINKSDLTDIIRNTQQQQNAHASYVPRRLSPEIDHV